MRGLVINIIIDRFGGWLDFLMPVGIRVLGLKQVMRDSVNSSFMCVGFYGIKWVYVKFC